MFLQYYGLREQPFGVTPNPRYLYHSPAHREALASLIYGIEADLGFAALIAEPGMGKTTLLFYLLEKFRNTARTALVFQTQCNAVELLRYVANELEVPAEEADAVVLFDRIRDVLVREARAGRRVVVIIDEAQNLSEEALEAIRLLSDFETPEFKLLHIILAGQPPLAEKLARPALAQLLQRIAMLNRLVPFSEVEDVSRYIAYRLKVAGYSGPPLFAHDALELITKHSGGIPRQINRICFNALSIGCAAKKRLIDGAIVREVLTDLDVASMVRPSPIDMFKPVELEREQDDDLESEAVVAGSVPESGRDWQAESVPAAASGTRRSFATAMDTASTPARVTQSTEAPVVGALAVSPALVSDRVMPAPVADKSATLPYLVPGPAHGTSDQRRNSDERRAPARANTVPSKAPARPSRRVPPVPRVQATGPRPLAKSNSRTSLTLIVLCVVAVPLLVLAAWFYLEKEHVLPGTQPSSPAIEQTTPAPNDHGDSVTLPQEPASPPKSKKPESGKRSELRALPPAGRTLGQDSLRFQPANLLQS
jgi:type II secretory pathway predicted ATPase ExeA